MAKILKNLAAQLHTLVKLRPYGASSKSNRSSLWFRTDFVTTQNHQADEPERRYRAWHKGEEALPFSLGMVQFVDVTNETCVANLIGQHDIRPHGDEPPIRYEAVREGLRRIAEEALSRHASVHMPRIGCGLAGGQWEEICAVIEQELISRGIAVTVYDLPSRL